MLVTCASSTSYALKVYSFAWYQRRSNHESSNGTKLSVPHYPPLSVKAHLHFSVFRCRKTCHHSFASQVDQKMDDANSMFDSIFNGGMKAGLMGPSFSRRFRLLSASHDPEEDFPDQRSQSDLD